MCKRQHLPPEIIARFNAKVASGWFYELAALPPGRSPQLWHQFEDLALGDLEQLVEWHKRRALKAVARFRATGSPRTAETAADHIWRAERYRVRYHELLGDARPDTLDETDPVFPEF